MSKLTVQEMRGLTKGLRHEKRPSIRPFSTPVQALQQRGGTTKEVVDEQGYVHHVAVDERPGFTDATPQQVIDAIDRHHGIRRLVAEDLGCHVNTVSRYVKTYPEVALALAEATDRITDKARDNLAAAIMDDSDIESSKWWLSRRSTDFNVPVMKHQIAAEVVFRVEYESTNGKDRLTLPKPLPLGAGSDTTDWATVVSDSVILEGESRTIDD